MISFTPGKHGLWILNVFFFSGDLEDQTEKLIEQEDTTDAGKENVAYEGSPERRQNNGTDKVKRFKYL